MTFVFDCILWHFERVGLLYNCRTNYFRQGITSISNIKFFFFIECDYQCQMLFYFLSLFRSTSIFPGVVCLFYEASGFDFICLHVINVLLYQDSSLKIYSIGKDVRLQNDHFKRWCSMYTKPDQYCAALYTMHLHDMS